MDREPGLKEESPEEQIAAIESAIREQRYNDGWTNARLNTSLDDFTIVMDGAGKISKLVSNPRESHEVLMALVGLAERILRKK